MIKKLIYNIFLTCICLATSVVGKSQFAKSGVVTSVDSNFNPVTKKFVLTLHVQPAIYLYKDSMVIERIVNNYINYWNNEDADLGYKIMYYYFIDLRNKCAYQYPAFSADSMFTQTFKRIDSVPLKYGWPFCIKITPASEQWVRERNYKRTADTVIDNINYKRVEASVKHKTDNGDSLLWIETSYFRCDKKGSFLNIDVGGVLGKIMNIDCPCVISEHYSPEVKWGYQKFSLTFLPRKLTKEERKVFKAWEKNEKLYPINKQE